MNKHNPQTRLMISYFTLAVSIIAVFLLISNLDVVVEFLAWVLDVIGPFISGFIIAYLLSIPCKGIQRLLGRVNVPFIQKRKKGLSIILVYLICALIIYFTLALLLPPTISSAIELAQQLPGYILRVEAWLYGLDESGQLPFEMISLSELNDMVTAAVAEWLTFEDLMMVFGTLFSGATMVFRAVLALVASVYFLFESENIIRFFKRLGVVFLSTRTNQVVCTYANKINHYFQKYIYCLIIDCVLMAAFAIPLLWALQSPYALFLGILLGVMNFIPYFGSIIATAVAVLVVFFTQDFTMGVVAAILLLILQQLDANVVQPRLYGGTLKLSPLMVIICVTVGGAIGGTLGGAVGGVIMGMIVAIPITKVVADILDDVMAYWEREKERERRIPTRGI